MRPGEGNEVRRRGAARVARAVLVASALLAAAVPGTTPASEVAAMPARAPAGPTWGQAWDVGYGYVVAAVSRGPFGESVARVFPWEAIERCLTVKGLFDPAKGDPPDAVHSVDLGVPDGKHVAVVREVEGKPALKKGCLAKALLAAKPAVVPPGLARVNFVFLPRAAFTYEVREAEILSATGAAAAVPAVREAVRRASGACVGVDWVAHGDVAPLRTTGKITVTIAARGDRIVEVTKALGKPASKAVVACLKAKLTPPPAPAPAPAPGSAAATGAPATAAPTSARPAAPVPGTFTFNLVAGGALLVDDPISIKTLLPAPPK